MADRVSFVDSLNFESIPMLPNRDAVVVVVPPMRHEGEVEAVVLVAEVQEAHLQQTNRNERLFLTLASILASKSE